MPIPALESVLRIIDSGFNELFWLPFDCWAEARNWLSSVLELLLVVAVELVVLAELAELPEEAASA